MFKFLSKLMFTGKLKFEEGEIEFCGSNMTMIPMMTMKDFTDFALKEGDEAIQRLYLFGWHFGFNFTRDYMKTLDLNKFEETYKLIMDVSELIGYGEYETRDFKQREFSRFENKMNPFAKLYHPNDEKVCHFVRGMNAGGGTALHGVLMNGIEVKCTAENGKICEFLNVANNLLKEKEEYKEAVKKQLDLDWLKDKQLSYIEDYGEDPENFLEYPES